MVSDDPALFGGASKFAYVCEQLPPHRRLSSGLKDLLSLAADGSVSPKWAGNTKSRGAAPVVVAAMIKQIYQMRVFRITRKR